MVSNPVLLRRKLDPITIFRKKAAEVLVCQCGRQPKQASSPLISRHTSEILYLILPNSQKPSFSPLDLFFFSIASYY